MSSSPDLSRVLPRVLIVSRRTVRKNKFVDFVGEYHLDLIVGYGAVPVIVPRVAGVHALLDSFEPIHGVLLCEGEDIDPSLYDSSADDADAALSPEQLEAVRRLHPSDAAIDHEKDSIELRLARRCLERNIPYLGICRGSQVLNVACGGSLYQDVEHELAVGPAAEAVQHINYGDYDGHRHPVRVLPGTPLHEWFAGDLAAGDDGAQAQLMVNSYHHQGVRRLAQRFAPMAVAPDGLVEAFYDPDTYSPGDGRFIMGLQFHPERMRKPGGSDEFDYPGCARAYQEFVRAVVAYQEKTAVPHLPRAVGAPVPAPPKLSKEMERRRKVISRSFSLAKDMYLSGGRTNRAEQRDLEAGAEFLESNRASLSVQQEKRLKQMGATVRNASGYLNSLKVNGVREAAARALMAEMTVNQLSDLAAFYGTMGKICSEVLDAKLQALHVNVNLHE